MRVDVPRRWAVIAIAVAAVTACGPGGSGGSPAASGTVRGASTVKGTAKGTAQHAVVLARPGVALPAPAALTPFPGTAGTAGTAGQGIWQAAGRLAGGTHAVYTTTLVPPGGSKPAGIAWMDTGLLTARLYSGSVSPGGGPYRYTAPIQAAQAATLVAAFNGGFKMVSARGGYYTEGRTVFPLRRGAASLVIYADGIVNIGAWGTDVSMTGDVVSVRQNLTPLVIGGQPAPRAGAADWLRVWGSTCGESSCSPSVPGLEHQWRSAAGITADGALIYVTGPALSPLQLARLLVRAGAVRGMELDINPYWPVFVSYAPATPGGLASAANGTRLLPGTTQGPATFFEPSWSRDFITMSAREPG